MSKAKPLFVFKYYINNKKRFIPVFAAISLSTFILYSAQMLVDSLYETTCYAFVEPHKHYSMIKARGELISPDTARKISEWDTVESVLPVVFHYTNINAVIEQTGTQALAVRTEDIKTLMSLMNLKLKEGRLPSGVSNEIILHDLVARNKQLGIGDMIGSDVEGSETLTGEYSVVGIIEGSAIISFFPMEPFVEKYKIPNPDRLGMIIIPKDGVLDEMNKEIEKLDFTGVEIRTLGIVQNQLESGKHNVSILLNLISIGIIIIVSLCIGFLCYIYFLQRRSELGFLSAIGFTVQEVTNRAFAEAGIISILGFSAGLGFSLLTGLILKHTVFLPSGQMLRLWSPDYFIKSLCIPLFVTLFGIIPVWRILKKLDPVSVIEGKGDLT